ncbi:MAG: hypothetical protein KIS92_00930 [Planctomycetota bacterium]|nr:hypothetical protein [Planctomycetota bacterium]
MATGTSLPSDFTPVPQIMNAHMQKAFVTRSYELLKTWVGGPERPIFLQNQPAYAGKGGQYTENPYFKRAVTAERRDITSNSALTAVKVEGGNNKGVILNRRTPLVEFTDDIFLMGLSPAQISAELGRQAGEIVADDMSNIFIAALIGMVEAMTAGAHTDTVWNASTRTNFDPNVLDRARFLMGDRVGVLRWLLARAEVKKDLSTDANGRAIDMVAGLHLQGDDGRNVYGMERAFVDNADLTVADAGYDKYITLLAGPGVMRGGFIRPVQIETDRRIERETKTTQWRADYDFVIESDHMGWNSGAGGANPSLTALKSSANWSVGYENHKELPLVESIHNYSGN